MKNRLLNFILLGLCVFGFFAPNSVQAQYAVNGNAVQQSCNCYRLTPDANEQSGSVWNLNQINLYNYFDYVFDVFLGYNDNGADGIGFVLQPISTTIGSSGGGMGFAGISPSWAVEMDTYQNGDDPGYDHIAIIRNGNVDHGSGNTLSGPVQMSSTSANTEDGAWHQLRVIWDPGTLEMLVFFDGVLRLSNTYDIIGNVFGGDPQVYWGFTAATGGSRNEHHFCVGLVPQISLVTSSVCQGEAITFNDNSLSTLGIADWSWDFGDGNTSTDQSPTHTYAASSVYNVDLTVTDINGCTATSSQQVTVFAAPNVNAGVDQAFCDGISVNLNASGATSYSWSPVTGLSNPNISNPIANPTSSTSYTVTGTDANGCSNSDNLAVVVNPIPVSDFDYNNVCLGDAMQFADNSTVSSGAINTYAWDFGDGNTSSLVNPSHIYSAQGVYTVTLEVTSDAGCFSTLSQDVEVYPVPQAEFIFTNECLDTPISFTDQSSVSSGAIVQWNWDFGDGDVSSNQNPQHSYQTAGIHTVTLEAESSEACVSTQTYDINAYPMPVADFTAPDVCLGNPMDFIDNSSVSSGTISTWDWDFGDGNTSQLQSPSNTYQTANTFPVSLTVETDNNCVATVNQDVQVSTLPVADFNFLNVCDDNPMSFTNTSTISVGTITQYQWDFGDFELIPAIPNSTSSDENPMFTYGSPGFYNVTLTSISGVGCSNSVQQQVAVYANPYASFSTDTVCFGETTNFLDESTVIGDAISSWQWNFDDGNSSIAQNPTNNYANEGSYHVALTVTSSNGCQGQLTEQVIVHATPIADFDNTSVCLNELTDFTDLSTIDAGNIDSYSWDFGDGNVSSTQNTSNTYLAAGLYNVILSVISDEECTDEITKQVEVFPLPQVDFIADLKEGCQPLLVQFIDQSSIDAGYSIVQRNWDLGGTTTTETSPEYLYINDGTYDVGLTATSANGCVSTLAMSDFIDVYPKPKAAFVFGPQPASVFNPVIDFLDQSSGANEWNWEFGDIETSTLQNPAHEYPDSGLYRVRQIVFNEYACSDTIYDTVVIDPEYAFYVPNSFTPNSNGINDEFKPKGYGVKTITMRIFTRWGEQIFTTQDMEEGWNGQLNNEGLEMIPDVYIYQINTVDFLGELRVYHGKVVLVR